MKDTIERGSRTGSFGLLAVGTILTLREETTLATTSPSLHNSLWQKECDELGGGDAFEGNSAKAM